MKFYRFLFIATITLIGTVVFAKDFNVKDFGAVGDGQTVDSPAIQRAIDACEEAGGGKVIVPHGEYLAATIQIKNNVTLHVSKGAVILGVTDPTQYVNVDPFIDGIGQNRGTALIAAVEVKNIGLEGEGVINGRGTSLAMPDGSRMTLRPFLLRIVRCEGVVVKNITLINSAAWTTHFFESKYITIDGIKIRSRGMGNNDGIGIDCSSNIRISNCDIDSGDDALVFKTTSPKMPCKDIVVTGMRLKSDHGAIKMGTESTAPFEDIKISDCYIYDTNNGGIKLLTVDGAKLRNIEISDITMENVRTAMLFRLGARMRVFRSDDEVQPVGVFENVVIKNVKVKISEISQLKYPTGIMITGIPNHYINGLTLENIEMNLPGGGTKQEVNVVVPEAIDQYPEIKTFGPSIPAYGVWARHARNLTLRNISFSTQKTDMRPALFFEDVKGATIDHVRIPIVPEKEEEFRRISSENISINQSNVY